MTTHTTSKKTKAALCAGAAFALLLGGGSTYAAWSEQRDLALDPVDIDTGSWTFDLDSDTDWFDVSPETEVAGSPVPVPIADLASFPLVPGDRIQGVVTVDPDLVALMGDHLDASVGAVSVKDQPATTVMWLSASAAVSGNDEVTVTIEFPYDATNEYSTQNGETVAVDLGTLTVTVQQVRPALDTP